jgi:DNA-binding NtrC family response regulator
MARKAPLPASRAGPCTAFDRGITDALRPVVVSSQPPSSAEPVLASRPLRVLLAEDDREMRRLLVAILRRSHCDVIEAKTGSQLWELIVHGALGTRSEPQVDLIITDVRMPGRSGLDVLSSLRKRDAWTPVILITAFGDTDTHAEAHRLGALAVFNKPFDLDDLRMIVVSMQRPDAVPPLR